MKDLDSLLGGDERTYDEYLKITNRCKEIIEWMLNERTSIRRVAEETGLSKSTIHLYIHTYIRQYFDEEYQQIKVILRFNKKYRCRPRKYWYRVGTPW